MADRRPSILNRRPPGESSSLHYSIHQNRPLPCVVNGRSKGTVVVLSKRTHDTRMASANTTNGHSSIKMPSLEIESTMKPEAPLEPEEEGKSDVGVGHPLAKIGIEMRNTVIDQRDTRFEQAITEFWRKNTVVVPRRSTVGHRDAALRQKGAGIGQRDTAPGQRNIEIKDRKEDEDSKLELGMESGESGAGPMFSMVSNGDPPLGSISSEILPIQNESELKEGDIIEEVVIQGEELDLDSAEFFSPRDLGVGVEETIETTMEPLPQPSSSVEPPRVMSVEELIQRENIRRLKEREKKNARYAKRRAEMGKPVRPYPARYPALVVYSQPARYPVSAINRRIPSEIDLRPNEYDGVYDVKDIHEW